MPNASLELAPQIGGPEKIQPSSIQSDTFTGGEKPAIDHNLSALADSLGYFNKNLLQYARVQAADKLVRDKEAEAELKKQQMQESHNRLSKYLSGVTDDQLRTDIQTGRVDFSADPYVGDMWKKHAADVMVRGVVGQLDKEAREGRIPFGDDRYHPEQDVLNRVAEERKKYGAYDDAAFNDEVAKRIRPLMDQARAKHEDYKGRYYQGKNEQIAYDKFSDAIQDGIDAGLTGKDLSDHARSVHREIGPIISGGDYGVANDKLDELQLKAMAEAAQDPRQAEAVIGMLHAPRKGLNGEDLPPLSAALKNKDAAAHIIKTANTALNKDFIADVQAKVLANDVAAIERMDSSIVGVKDGKVLDRNEQPVPHLGAKERIEAATQVALDRIRQQNPDPAVALDKEIEITQRNSIKHPTLFGQMETLVKGLGGSAQGATQVGEDQIAAITHGAELYEKAANQNYTWTHENLSKEARDKYSTFILMTRDMGMSPKEAAYAIAASSAKGPVHVSFNKDQRDAIELAARNASTKEGWFGNSVANQGPLADKIEEVARAYRANGIIDDDAAIKKATETVVKNFTAINGSLVSSSDLPKDAAPFAEKLIADEFKSNKAAFEARGITDSKQLTLVPFGRGVFMAVPRDGSLPVSVPVVKDGKVVDMYVPRFTVKQIKDKRDAAVAAAEQHLDETARRKSGLLPQQPEQKQPEQKQPLHEALGNPMGDSIRF